MEHNADSDGKLWLDDSCLSCQNAYRAERLNGYGG